MRSGTSNVFVFSLFSCRVDKAVRMLEHMLMITPSGRAAGEGDNRDCDSSILRFDRLGATAVDAKSDHTKHPNLQEKQTQAPTVAAARTATGSNTTDHAPKKHALCSLPFPSWGKIAQMQRQIRRRQTRRETKALPMTATARGVRATKTRFLSGGTPDSLCHDRTRSASGPLSTAAPAPAWPTRPSSSSR